MAIGTAGIGAVGTAALATGITFVIASVVGRRMSDSVGQALGAAVGLGIVGLLIAMVIQLVGSIFVPGFGGNSFELLIAGFGTVLFVGAAFVDFYTMPRAYRDDQYLAGALGMYLTYINLFIFILRLIIALQGGGRRD
jgi:FtsH-binding integral membrane protein